MPNISNSDRKYGFREILYNIVTREFYTPVPGGGRFHELDISVGGDANGGGASTTTADVALVSPTTLFTLEGAEGLTTQQDLNVYFAENIPTLTSELNNDSGYITVDSVPTKTSQLENDTGFITAADVPDVDVDAYTKAESDAKYLAVNISTLSELPTV